MSLLSFIFTEEKSFCDFLFISMDYITFQKIVGVTVKVSHSLVNGHRGSGDYRPIVSWAQLMKSRADPSPFLALFFLD